MVQSGRRVNHAGTLADRLAAGGGGGAGRAATTRRSPWPSRPDVADHHHAVQLRGRLALELIARAAPPGRGRRPGRGDRRPATWPSGSAPPPDALAAARLSLADRVAAEVRADLDAGEPGRVVERIEDLARHKIGGPALRRTREIAEAWQVGAGRGPPRRVRPGPRPARPRRAARRRRRRGRPGRRPPRRRGPAEGRRAPRSRPSTRPWPTGQWPEILAAAEAVLEIVPEHPAARQARTRAWQQIAAIGPSAATLPEPRARGSRSRPRAADAGAADRPAPARRAPCPDRGRADRLARRRPEARRPAPPPRPLARAGEPGPEGRFLLWVDAVGGYLVCLDDQVVLGRAGHDSHADVPLMGDLSRHHATLVRDGDGYVLRAHQPTFVNGRPVETAPLRDGDVIRLGSTVELEFRQPSPVSATARLAVVSRHRLPLAVDGVLLMAETCIVGGSPQAHIPAPGLADPVVLYRQGSALWCRAAGGFEVDGRACAARAPLTLQSSVLGDGFSFSLEPLGAKTV